MKISQIITKPEMTAADRRHWDCREQDNRDFCDGVAYDDACPFLDELDEDAWRTGWRESEAEFQQGT